MAVNFDLRSISLPSQSAKPEIVLTQSLVVKVAACLGIASMGLYFLMSGKEQKDFNRMVLGAILVIGAFFVF